jgi:hypothetical protein
MNKPSYRIFNYALRPHKSVERKMLIEAFRMLYPFAQVKSYKYVGFGSSTFVDFNMVHRSLGISDLTSIEKASDDSRFKFNAPYGCITLKMDLSNRVLPKLITFDTPCIVWLDYDGPLNGSVLTDIRIVAEQAVIGSMLIVTVNAEPVEKQRVDEGDADSDQSGNFSEVDSLKQAIGSDNVPPELRNVDFRKWGKAKIYRDVINAQIEAMMLTARRDGKLRDPDKVCEQVINFHYSDGAKMMTLGWLFHNGDERAASTIRALKGLDFVRSKGQTEFLIELPPLSNREIMYMEKQLPNDPANVQCPGLQPTEIANFCRVYKYYPTYIEAELR